MTASSPGWRTGFSTTYCSRTTRCKAPQAGFHQYDAKLPSGSRSEIDAETAALHQFEQEVAGFEPRGLSPGAAADRELLLAQIRGQLLTLEVIRPWEKNPDIYSSGVSNAVFVIMSRKFAPPAARLQSVIAREKLIPRLFQSARENLKNPPRIYTEVALEQIAGHRQLLPERRAGGIQRCERRGAAGGIQARPIRR